MELLNESPARNVANYEIRTNWGFWFKLTLTFIR